MFEFPNSPPIMPKSKIEKAKMLRNILISRATGGIADENEYALLRGYFNSNGSLRALLPEFIRTCGDLHQFWEFIKHEFETYRERREFIRNEFVALFDYIEFNQSSPSDNIVSQSLSVTNSENVAELWNKALERRASDPEGAITIARTLIESVCKYILEEANIAYGASDDLPKLYADASKTLSLAPSQHSIEAIKSILGSATNVVNGLGTLRNRLSDSHGRGAKVPVKPSSRHAKLAVNMAGAVATFLMDTFDEKNGNPPK